MNMNHSKILAEFDEKYSKSGIIGDRTFQEYLPNKYENIKQFLLTSLDSAYAEGKKDALKKVMEVIDERLQHWNKIHEESMPHNTLIGYHADSGIRALSNAREIIQNLIKE